MHKFMTVESTFEMSFCGFEPQYSVVIHSASSLQLVFNCFLDWIITNMPVTRPFVWTLHVGTKDSYHNSLQLGTHAETTTQNYFWLSFEI